MCLILFSFDIHPIYKLVLAANRDEFYARPTAPLTVWTDEPRVIAGRDLSGGGTWMGASPDGRLAALTNYRDPRAIKSDAPTRGTLVTDFLTGGMPGTAYLDELSRSAGDYNGFNLLVYDGEALSFFSNREGIVRTVPAGVHGLSNHLLDTPWPKIKRGRQLFTRAAAAPALTPERMFRVLEDRQTPPDGELPETGVGLEWERILSPLFIESDIYGTRSSSLVTIDRSGRLEFHERTHDPHKDSDAAAATRRIALQTQA